MNGPRGFVTALFALAGLSSLFQVGQPPAGTLQSTGVTVQAPQPAPAPALPAPVSLPLPVAKLGDMLAVAYVTPTVDAAGFHALDDVGGALRPLEATAVGYLAAVQPDWVTLGRRREIRADGRVWYGDLFSIPRKNLVSALLLQGGSGATLP